MCWGTDNVGQGSPPSGVQFTQVTAGYQHSCGIRKDDGTARCWGAGAGNRTAAPPGVPFTQLAAGLTHTCGVRSDTGAIQCWGGSTLGRPGPFVGVAVGNGHTWAFAPGTTS